MVLDKGDCLPSGDIFVSRMSMKHMTSLRIRYCTRMHLVAKTAVDFGEGEGSLKRFLIYVSNVGIDSQHVTFFNGRTYRDQLLAI